MTKTEMRAAAKQDWIIRSYAHEARSLRSAAQGERRWASECGAETRFQGIKEASMERAVRFDRMAAEYDTKIVRRATCLGLVGRV